MKKIAFCGNILVDHINTIEKYPNSGELTKIKSIKKATGGLVCNTGIDIKRLDESLEVFAIGKIGMDSDGAYVKDILGSNGIDCSLITISDKPTSFTDVMSVKGGQRTFFCSLASSDEFGYDDIDFTKLDVDYLHLGYFLLLEKIDAGDGLKILKKCQEKGIETSIDLVTENSNRYHLVIPCLSYVDNLIINEEEASHLTGISPSEDNMRLICQRLLDFGVRKRVIIHMPKYSFCMTKNEFIRLNSFDLPKDFIKGTNGAGDAFCAGALLGIINGLSNQKILETASIATLGALTSDDATSGMKSLEELRKIGKGLSRIKC